jgi:ribose transport system substrate-binding protein
MRRSFRTAVPLFAVLVGLLASGCGSDDSGDATASGESAATWQDEAKTVDKLLGETGTFKAPPSEAPDPEPGKKIALISCGQTITACKYATDGAKEATDAIGWESTLFDAKGDPTNAGTGVRQAVVAGVDGIFMYYVDCKYVAAALKEAKEAGIPVVSAEGVDCNKGGDTGDSLFTGEVTYVEGDWLEYVYQWEFTQFQYPIAKLKGKANMIVFGDNTIIGSEVAIQAAKDAYKGCESCKLDVKEFPITAIGTDLQQIAQEAILKMPDVNAIAGTYEAVILGGVEAASRASGKEVMLDIGEGNPEAMELLRSGRATYGAGLPAHWEGWSGIDGLVRILAGEEPVNSGIGLQLFDADHNMPASGGYNPPFDFRATYRKAWGVDG